MPDVWVDRCRCGHLKDDHKVVVARGRISLGECRRVSVGEWCTCLGFVVAPPASELPEPVAVAAEPDVAERSGLRPLPVMTERTEIVPERVEGPAPAAGGVLETIRPFAEGWSCDLVIPLPTMSDDDLEELKRKFMEAQTSGRMTVLPAPSPLASWDSWWCEDCGARAFEQRECCGTPMAPVRVEIHTREVA